MIVCQRCPVKNKFGKISNAADTYLISHRRQAILPASAPPRLILASSSPYRRELLTRLRLPFEVLSPAIDESILPGENAAKTALRLAAAKARKVGVSSPDSLVIGCDQVAALGGACLGK